MRTGLVVAVLAVMLVAWAHAADGVMDQHPAGAALRQVLATPAPAGFAPTGMSKADYLPLMAGVVDFFKQYQNPAGAIIDPFEKAERQYSTPAFALAAAELVRSAGRKDLLEPATRALTFSIAALANHTSADNHADFYIPMVMHARAILRPLVEQQVDQQWQEQLRSLVPEKAYRDVTAGANWNVVNVSGECLRRQAGLVEEGQLEPQEKYITTCLTKQAKRFTAWGMYQDPNSPLAYDAFPRLWLEDMLACGACPQALSAEWEQRLALGGVSTLLLLSPSGQWPCGGRSAQHQWNEAEVAVICQINANRWMKLGRKDVAGAFVRAARLALRSMKHWQRPSGEMWIVKNRAEPNLRHGYEGYSFHSQYNLLPMAMLAIAYSHADDSIAEAPIPSEVGGYVLDLREVFHKVVAAAGGMYVLIDTTADPHYNATGLQRVHRAGVIYSPLSDSSASQRGYGPGGNLPKLAMTPGIAWKATAEAPWRSLADFAMKPAPPAPAARGARAAEPAKTLVVEKAELTVTPATAGQVAFAIRYDLTGDSATAVVEQYVLSGDELKVTSTVECPMAPVETRMVFPALVSDGAADTQVKLAGRQVTVSHDGAELTCTLATAGGPFMLEGPRVVCHNGWMQAAVADLLGAAKSATWTATLRGH